LLNYFNRKEYTGLLKIKTITCIYHFIPYLKICTIDYNLYAFHYYSIILTQTPHIVCKSIVLIDRYITLIKCLLNRMMINRNYSEQKTIKIFKIFCTFRNEPLIFCLSVLFSSSKDKMQLLEQLNMRNRVHIKRTHSLTSKPSVVVTGLVHTLLRLITYLQIVNSIQFN